MKKKTNKHEDGLETSTNNIWNLIARTLSNKEFGVLGYGLNHGLTTYQTTSNIIATAESVWDQISRQNLCKELAHTYGKSQKFVRGIDTQFN